MKKKPDPEMIDKENPEWTDAMFAKARPASEIFPDLAIDDVPNRKNCRLPLTFALCSPMMTACTNGCHAQFVFNCCPRATPTHAGVVAGIGLEWNSVPSPKFVQPGCTVTQHHA